MGKARKPVELTPAWLVVAPQIPCPVHWQIEVNARLNRNHARYQTDLQGGEVLPLVDQVDVLGVVLPGPGVAQQLRERLAVHACASASAALPFRHDHQGGRSEAAFR